MVGKLYLNKADKRIWVFVRVRITHFHCSPKLLPAPSILPPPHHHQGGQVPVWSSEVGRPERPHVSGADVEL